MKKILPVLASAGLMLGAVVANAQTSAPGSTGTGPTGAGIPNTSPSEQQPGPGASSLSQEDRRFAQLAFEGNAAEVQAGNLALTKAQDPAVKAFAQRMVDDHGTAMQQLGGIMGGQGGNMPKAGGEEAQAMLEKLKGLSGAAFDRAYMAYMAKDHDKDVAMYEDQAKSANDSRLRTYVVKTLPILKEHQAQARTLDQKLAKSS